MKSLFITGTDTEIGKTVVAVEIIKYLQSIGNSVCGYKPIASDAKKIDGHLVNQDALALIAAGSVKEDYSIHNPVVYEPAISPNIAAKLSNHFASLDLIEKNFFKLSKKCDVVVVEGAGGWRSPLGQDLSSVDLVRTLKMSCILVVEIKLGCINHALLTAEAMLHDDVEIIGWIANGPLCATQHAEDVLETLIEILPLEYLGRVEKKILDKPSGPVKFRFTV